MKFGSEAAYIEFSTDGGDQMTDITDRVAAHIDSFGLKNGTATIFVIGTTASVIAMEYEPGLEADIKSWLGESIPAGDWRHDATWSEANGHSHIRASVFGPSLAVPVVQGRMTLGTWQQIVVIDHDVKPRTRKIVVQMMGTIYNRT